MMQLPVIASSSPYWPLLFKIQPAVLQPTKKFNLEQKFIYLFLSQNVRIDTKSVRCEHVSEFQKWGLMSVNLRMQTVSPVVLKSPDAPSFSRLNQEEWFQVF